MEDEAFAASAVSRSSWITSIGTGHSHAYLVGSCPLHRQVKFAEMAPSAQRPSESFTPLCVMSSWLPRKGSIQQGMTKSTAATKWKPAALGGKYSTCVQQEKLELSSVVLLKASIAVPYWHSWWNKAPVSVTSERENPPQNSNSPVLRLQFKLFCLSPPPDKFGICQTTEYSCENLTQTLIRGSPLHKTLTVHVRGQLYPHSVWELCYQPAGPLKRVSFSFHLGESDRPWFCWPVHKGKAEKFHRRVQNLLAASALPWPPPASHQLQHPTQRAPRDHCVWPSAASWL